MIIVDAHEDIAYNHVCFGRDYTRSALEKRRLEAGRYPVPMLGMPDAMLGRVAIVFATLFVSPSYSKPSPWPEPTYHNAREAYTHAMTQLDYYHKLADESEKITLIQESSDLDAVLATWKRGEQLKGRKHGLVILMEGADPILEPRQFEEWYERGVRIVGPAWMHTRYSAGTGAGGGLTHLGHELLEIMANYNAILDVSHMAEHAFMEAVDRYTGSVIASHSNPRRFCDTDRHLSDQMIVRLAERDGVMGIVMFNGFFKRDWRQTDKPGTVTMTHVLDAIDHVCQVTGSAAHVGIGSDFDGGFGAESTPDELDSVSDLWNIGAGLRTRGYTEDDIAAILGENMLRKLREALS